MLREEVVCPYQRKGASNGEALCAYHTKELWNAFYKYQMIY